MQIKMPSLQGYQKIAAIWLPFEWFSLKKCQQLVIQYWHDGYQLFAFEQGYLLRYPAEQGQYCHNLEGWPLINIDGRLCSMQLRNNESQFLPKADLVLFLGNELWLFNYTQSQQVNPAQWLELDEYTFTEIDKWVIEVTEPVYIDPTADNKNMEEILGDKYPQQSEALEKFIKQKQLQKNKIAANSRYDTQQHNKSRFAKVLYFIFIVLLLMAVNSDFVANINFSWTGHNFKVLTIVLLIILMISSLFYFIRATRKAAAKLIIMNKNRHVNSSPDVSGEKQSLRQTSQSKSAMSEVRKLFKLQAWRNYFAHFAFLTKLHHLIMFRQSKYLNSMMKLFEQGKLDEALKYALPLNNGDNPSQQAFGVPKPRSKLSLSEKCYGSATSVYLESELQQQLKQIYRKSFETLEKENKLEEAVFVLIELLNNLHEGIEFLKKHKRYQQALDIAIARDAAPELIINLCCQLELWDKAIIIARRSNAFANAITLLENEQPEYARKLRLIWAQTLAEKSEWLAAIDAVWPLKPHRYLAEQWFNCLEKDELFKADVMVKRLILQPECFAKYQEEIHSLAQTPEKSVQRLAVARAILQHKENIDRLRGLLTPLINVMIADAMVSENQFNRAELLSLIDLTNNVALKVDFPLEKLQPKKSKTLAEVNSPQFITYTESGNRVIYDTVSMINQYYLVALGEAGVMMLDRKGKLLQHFMVCAQQFVVSYNRRQVLILSKRDDYYHIYKLDIVSRQLSDLKLIKFDYCNDIFDGINWTIMHNNCIRVVDVQNDFSIVWQTELSSYQVIDVATKVGQETWLLADQNQKLEQWNYQLPERRMISRFEVEYGDETPLLNHATLRINYVKYAADRQVFMLDRGWREYKTIDIKLSQKQFISMQVYFCNDFFVFLIAKENLSGFDIYFFHNHKLAKKMVVHWPKSDRIKARVGNNSIVFYDSQGRVCEVDVIKNQTTCFVV